MKLLRVFHRMLSMCPEAWYIFLRTIQLCVFLLLCCFVLLLEWNGSMMEGYTLFMTASALNETCQALLLIAVLGSVFIEDAQS
ncbi:MAG: hypothetical protein IJB09_10040 [Oscillospiraceae bacterium]|nr:hypothetical protein [Oscillospiraceae bacterium]